ncbi:MAG TPA: endonuclease III [Candidatus Nanoarchaeia archaeon]|nr:endonuclease III [Candidatus Nanoarchaeia archaeon]
MTTPPEKVLQLLHNEHPQLTHYLHFSNPLELMVATILSAQIRDDVVNAATKNLFAQYKTAKDYAKAEANDIVPIIKSITYANTKAKHIVEACKIIVEKHKSQVPRTMIELVELPGIGRKSANAILQNAFGIVEGVVVDTHVLRVCYRLGWTTSNTNAVKAERELMDIVPRKEWKNIPGLMKRHGRTICKPVPHCKECFLNELCPKKGV